MKRSSFQALEAERKEIKEHWSITSSILHEGVAESEVSDAVCSFESLFLQRFVGDRKYILYKALIKI
jgi:hypothetical protein